jgi:hypothetical protein
MTGPAIEAVCFAAGYLWVGSGLPKRRALHFQHDAAHGETGGAL